MSTESRSTKTNKLSEIRGKLEGKLDTVKLKIKKSLPLLHSGYVAVTTSFNKKPIVDKQFNEGKNIVGESNEHDRSGDNRNEDLTLTKLKQNYSDFDSFLRGHNLDSIVVGDEISSDFFTDSAMADYVIGSKIDLIKGRPQEVNNFLDSVLEYQEVDKVDDYKNSEFFDNETVKRVFKEKLSSAVDRINNGKDLEVQNLINTLGYIKINEIPQELKSEIITELKRENLLIAKDVSKLGTMQIDKHLNSFFDDSKFQSIDDRVTNFESFLEVYNCSETITSLELDESHNEFDQGDKDIYNNNVKKRVFLKYNDVYQNLYTKTV